MTSTYFSLFFTVALLVATAYFIMGGIPLLVLSHDTPMDGRFIRRFFEIYYTAALTATAGAAVSYAFWGKVWFVLGLIVIAAAVVALRRTILPAMDRLGSGIQASRPGAISNFRKVHGIALLINVGQLVVLVWGVLHISD